MYMYVNFFFLLFSINLTFQNNKFVHFQDSYFVIYYFLILDTVNSRQQHGVFHSPQCDRIDKVSVGYF